MKRLYLIIISLFLPILAYSNRDTTIVSYISYAINSGEITNSEPGFKKYVDEDIPYLYKHMDSLVSIKVVASSSPEGTLYRNTQLAFQRARRITTLLPSDLPADISYEIANANEILNYVDDKIAKAIKPIIDSGRDINKKLSKTPYYSYLFREIYPKLRYTKIEMVFHLTEENKEAEKDPIILTKIDTVFRVDTVYQIKLDTVYLEKPLKVIPILAVKTNLIGDALLFTNIQAELYTWISGISLEFAYGCPWWKIDSKHLYYQTLNGRVAIKKYFFPTYRGLYFSLYGNSGIYDYSWSKDEGVQGEYYGGGMTLGFVYRSAKNPRIKFEPYISVGIIHTVFDKYHASEPYNGKYYYTYTGKSSEFVPRRFSMDYFGPTAIGFNLTYDLICIRRY